MFHNDWLATKKVDLSKERLKFGNNPIYQWQLSINLYLGEFVKMKDLTKECSIEILHYYFSIIRNGSQNFKNTKSSSHDLNLV